MIPCLVRRGLTGPQSCRSPELATCVRRLSRATTAAAVARAGIKMSEKFSIESINELHDEWCRDNGYPVYKPSSKVTQEESPQAKGSSFRSPESASSGTWDPEYKRTS